MPCPCFPARLVSNVFRQSANSNMTAIDTNEGRLMPTLNKPADKYGQTSSSDLWSKALDTLDVEIRNSYDFAKNTRGTVLFGALKQAQAKRQLCTQKCWTFQKRSGETYIVRDVVEKIIVWIEKFIAVGDIAIQYDPVHAAPAWAVFRFVLQVIIESPELGLSL